MKPPPTIRPSEDYDIPAITDIYAHHVQHTTSSFELDPPDSTEVARRRQAILRAGLPWLVADLDGAVAGYAYAGPYRPRAAYRFTLEDSIYIHPGHMGKGIGTLLLPRLIELCEATGSRQIIAVIGGCDNAPSVRLHEKFGFRHVGILESVGFKFDRCVDTILMQRPLRRPGYALIDR